MSSKMTTVLLLLGANKFYGNPAIGRTMLVKQIYLVEQLRPAYELWVRSFEFVRYRYGPYSEDIFHNLNQLIFAGLVTVPEFHTSNSKVEATYDTTAEGDRLCEKLATEAANAKLATLCRDLVWSLQSFGVQTAKQIVDIVYQEPEFVQVSDEANRRGDSKDDKVRLRDPHDSDHPSFRIQAVLKQIGTKKLGPQFTPRELVRTYLLTLALQKHQPAAPEGERSR